MASALSKEVLNYRYMAKVYSNLNELQVKFGKEFISVLCIKPGEKVLDMGCGTGELTTYIADQVGEEGHVVGVDPDKERIKVATQKHLHGRQLNLCFVTGDSSSDFPHSNEEYYDIHISNFVFLWLTLEEKTVYLKTAMKCMKHGGRIAIHCQEKNPEMFGAVEQLLPDDRIGKDKSPFQLVSKATAEAMFREAGFAILSSEYEEERNHTFRSVDEYITWYCASGYLDENQIVPAKRKAFAEKYARVDGTVYLKITFYHIIAKK